MVRLVPTFSLLLEGSCTKLYVVNQVLSRHYLTNTMTVNCSAETNHMITNAVFNLSSDVMIIALPMPVLIGSQLPLKRKLTLCCVFALGIFTILAAILSKYYSLGTPYGTQWIYW